MKTTPKICYQYLLRYDYEKFGVQRLFTLKGGRLCVSFSQFLIVFFIVFLLCLWSWLTIDFANK